MLFTIQNKKFLSREQLRTSTLLRAYSIIKNYPMGAADKLLDTYLQQQCQDDLKNSCIKLLLKLTASKDNDGNMLLLFNDPKDDKLARLITYGNGAIQGSQILTTALKQ